MNISCPLCKRDGARYRMTAPFDCKSFKPIKFGAIYECGSCSFGFVHPRPTRSETDAFYELDSYYTHGKSHMPDTGKAAMLSRLRTHLAWRADAGRTLSQVIRAHLAPTAAIVDIGCGGGNLLRELSAVGYRMIGVERDASSVSRIEDDCEVLEGSAEFLPTSLSAEAYEGVVFSHVVEHLVDPVNAVRLAASLLHPRGMMFIEVPNNESEVAKQSGETWEHLDVPRHLNFFGKRSIHELVKAAGMRVVDTYFGGYNRYFHDSYIATEQRIYDQFIACGWKPLNRTRNSATRSWRLLCRTALAEAPRKYDSIGVVAVPGAAQCAPSDLPHG